MGNCCLKCPATNSDDGVEKTSANRRNRRPVQDDDDKIEGLLLVTTTGAVAATSTTTTTTTPSSSVKQLEQQQQQLLKKPKTNLILLNGNNNNLGSVTVSNKELVKAAQCQLLGQISDNKINALFETYRDVGEGGESDAILAVGIERLCSDLHYKPEDFAILVLAWRLDASQMCRFTKAEFIQGLHTLNADSIESIRQRLEEEVCRLRVDSDLFKNIYRFTFRFGLEAELRTLRLDMAISLWRLVFTVHKPAVLDKWLDYLEVNPQNIRGIPKDTWNMFLNFAETCDIYSYSDEDAWPSVFDDFVEYENDQRRRKGQLEEEMDSDKRIEPDSAS